MLIVCTSLYLVSSVVAVFAVFTDVVLQLLDLQLGFIVLFPYLISLCALCLEQIPQLSKYSQTTVLDLFIRALIHLELFVLSHYYFLLFGQLLLCFTHCLLHKSERGMV